MREKREKFRKKRINKVLEDLLKTIETKETGEITESNWQISKDKFIAYLEEKIHELEMEIKGGEKREFDRKILPDRGIFAKDDHVILKIIESSEKDNYMKLSEQCSVSTSLFEESKESIWQEFLSPNTYVCSIYDADTGDYVGYCSIKELDACDWEIAIELLQEYRNKRYGTHALNLFMDRITEITGNRFYKFLIDVDNEASQKLVRRLGAYPDGLAEFFIHGEDLDSFREENINMIDEHIIHLAEEFTSDPEELIGRVLQYRIDRKK